MTELESLSMRRSVYTGAMHGITVWLIYGIIEGLFSIILPWFVKPHYEYIQLHSGFTGLLFVLYPVLGLTIGGLIGFGISMAARTITYLQQVQLKIFFPSIAMFTIVLIFDLNLVVNSSGSFGLSEFPPLAMSFLIAFSLVLSTVSSTWLSRLRFLANPWTASFLLVGLPWINHEILMNYSDVVKAVAALFYAVVILLTSFVIHQFVLKCQMRRPTDSKGAFPGTSIAILIPIVLLVLGINVIFKQAPLRESLNVKSSSQLTDKPNVILIVMDTVRADHLSLYGYERDITPHLKSFAEEATLYANAILPSDITLSSHASLFTGLYPAKHGAHYGERSPHGRWLDDKFITIAETLADKGYLTLGVAANIGVLGRGFGLDQGFQYYNAQRHVPFLQPIDPYYLREGLRNFFKLFSSQADFDQKCRRAADINREVFSLLDKIEGKGSFFLFINYMDAHDPYIPPYPFDILYPGKDGTFTTKRYRQLIQDVMRFNHSIDENEYLHLESQYDGGISYIDSFIGKLIDKLKKNRSYENTLIIITSDHGEAFGERYLVGHGVSVYSNQINIPLVIKYPHVKQGYKVTELVSGIDIMPTVLDVLGYEFPHDLDGQSLLTRNKLKERNIVSESYPTDALLKGHQKFDRIERALLSGPYKLISSTAGKRELYDLSNDPDEKKNLYHADDSISIELDARLNQWLDTITEESYSPAKLDKNALDRLKALGYIK